MEQDQDTQYPEKPKPENGQSSAPKANFLTILRNAGFRNLWLGQVVSQVGDYFAFLATVVVVTGFSSDDQATTLAVAGMLIANSLPRLLFGMLAGVFVDRWDRRTTMIVSDLVRVVLALGFIPAFLSRNLFAMYALGFAMSTLGTLFLPAKGALIPKLVPKDQLLSANSLSQTSQMLSILLGPALAGFTLKLVGPGNEWAAFVVDSATFLISALAIRLIRVPIGQPGKVQAAAEVPTSGSRSKAGQVWGEMLVGVKMLFLNRTMATLAAVFGITMLGVGAVNVLWAVFLKIQFGYEGPELAWRFSLLDIVFAVGMMASTIAAGNLLSNLAPKWFIVISLVGVSFPLLIFGMLHDYWLVAAASAVMGIFVAPINTAAMTLMQIVVPNEQLGRVGGGLGTVIETATVTSMSLAGVLGAAVGVPIVFAGAGVMCMLGGLLALWRLPAVTLADKPEEAPEEAPTEQQAPAMHIEGILDPELPMVEV